MGKWLDMQVFDFDNNGTKTRRTLAKGYFRDTVYQTLEEKDLNNFGATYKADFIYHPESKRILKNRYGSIENLYEDAVQLMRLRHHPNEQVRKAFEKAEMLAALTEE